MYGLSRGLEGLGYADTVKDVVLRIKEANAPPEGLDGMLIIQLSAAGGTRYVKEVKVVVTKGREVEIADASEITPKLAEYVREMYETDLKKELTLRVEALVKAAEMEDPAAARRAILETLWSRVDFKAAVEEEAGKFGYA